MNEAIINFERLEKSIISIEQLFISQDINIEEQQLIIKKVNDRILIKIQKQRQEDIMNGMSTGSLMGIAKKFMKGKDSEE